MSKYLLLGIFLSISTSLLCMRILTPKWFFSIFRGGSAQEMVDQTNDLQTAIIVNTPIKSNGKKIQLALLLDTSNSMDGLIEQAKSQLWMLVNELVSMQKDGVSPDVEIALYQYGNDELPILSGYIQQITPFSSDLDLISKQLFALGTNGGSEYCGEVIKDALTRLNWTNHPNDLKMVFIAGNEPFNQGSVGYTAAVQSAFRNNIMVNTIHCGSYEDGKKDLWLDAAQKGGGEYLNIDHNDQVVHIPTPYDDEIISLNSQLNKTYIYYGHNGLAKAQEQVRQDQNALTFSDANFRTRTMVKSKKVYDNSEWDMVDMQTRSGSSDFIDDIDVSQIPLELKDMSVEERKSYVTEKSIERKAIKEKLQELEAKVKQYLAQETAKLQTKQTLDHVMISAIKRQAAIKDFKSSK
ncbi:MAG: VWA domain-containing protein [Saprospiraceae bacterium]|nr:VWA domain-containing protein [Saprospiraceae bacterium]